MMVVPCLHYKVGLGGLSILACLTIHYQPFPSPPPPPVCPTPHLHTPRFSNDQGRVDDQLPMALFDVLQTGFMCLGAFVLVAIAVPVVLPVFVPLLMGFYMVRARYVVTSREVKRLEAVTRSPVYAQLSAVITVSESQRVGEWVSECVSQRSSQA